MAGDLTFVEWLIQGGLGPAAVALPVSWAARAMAQAGRKWWGRLTARDDLRRLVRGAAGDGFDLTDAELARVRDVLSASATWESVRRGTVGDLTAEIASCLPPGPGRSEDDSERAAAAIARGVLEFTVSELDPSMFQTVLFARLDRLESGLASDHEQLLADLHADLYNEFAASLAAQADLAAQRFRSVTSRLQRIEGLLDPRPARRTDVRTYLQGLADWLNDESWVRRWFEGPSLAPATIERKLRVADAEHEVDADEVVDICRRLVIVGGPGAGKTWLAKRSARRSAERALSALDRGASVSEIELPLYVTCRDLLTAGGSIGEAVASAAVDTIGYLGPSRTTAAIRRFVESWQGRTLLVIDSLDETAGLDDRPLRQADRGRWRMVLTTRPGAWTHQIDIMRGDGHEDRTSGQEGRDLVGRLLPLSYPDDVDAFIGRWFADDERQARVLIDQIADRPDLQDLVTVPLMLTLLCIMGGDEPLPRFRRELFARAVNRLLTGSWRHAPPGPVDRDVLLGQLRAWAWEAATDHPVSGVGTWVDEVATAPLPLDERHRLRRLDQPALDALDHVATPTRVAHVDTGTTPRRFIHRSVQEHLVAEHLADPHRFPLSEVTEILLPHLWFDTDWEYAAPAAVAGRLDRDALLRALILRAARAECIPSDISVIDGNYEFRAFLARLATQSDDTDWSEEMARIIGDARVALARDLRLTPVVASAHWAESNERARAALMTTLRERGKELRGASIRQWGHALVRLGGLPDERARARAALLQLVARRTEGHLEMGSEVVGDLLDELVRLGPTRAEEMQARKILGDLRERLHTETEIWVLARLASAFIAGTVALATDDSSSSYARRTLVTVVHQMVAERKDWLVERVLRALTSLRPTPDEKAMARKPLLVLLEDYRRPLSDAYVPTLISEYMELDPTAAERAAAGEVVLHRLTSMAPGYELTSKADALIDGLVRLKLDEVTRERARASLSSLVRRLDAEARPYSGLDRTQRALADGLVSMARTDDEKVQARREIVDILSSVRNAGTAAATATALARLEPTTADQARARTALLSPELWDEADLGDGYSLLASAVVDLDPSDDEKALARRTLLAAATGSARPSSSVDDMAAALLQLTPSPQESAAARAALVDDLVGRETGRGYERRNRSTSWPSAGDRREDLTAWGAGSVAQQLARFDPTPDERARARAALLVLLPPIGDKTASDPRDRWSQRGDSAAASARSTVDGLIALEPTAEERERARAAILELLACEGESQFIGGLVAALALLTPQPQETTTALRYLVDHPGWQEEPNVLWSPPYILVRGLVDLGCTIERLLEATAWTEAADEVPMLLTAARQNSSLEEWLRALPQLARLSS